MEMVFRPAVVSDSQPLAELIYLAAQGHCQSSGYALSLGGSRAYQVSQIEKLTRTKSRSWFHFSHFDVAEADAQVVASAAGFERAPADSEVDAALLEIGFSNADVEALHQRISEVYACFPPEPAGFWTIDHVAVMPSFRRTGLARTLIMKAIDRGRARGFRQFVLDVFRGNAAAKALYESLGFQVAETFGDNVFPGLLDREGIERMKLTFA